VYTEMPPDPRKCTPSTPDVCHPNANCTPVTPYVCSSTRARSYRCECNQGYSGDGLSCIGIRMLIFRNFHCGNQSITANTEGSKLTMKCIKTFGDQVPSKHPAWA